MNSGNSSSHTHARNSASGFSVDDAIFTLFRHKWLIFAFVCLGVVGAGVVRLKKPPLYVSKAKLMVHYVLNTREIAPGTPDASQPQALDATAQSVIGAEIEILTSLDVATNVAQIIGPARILAHQGGGSNLLAAAGVVCSGIEVDPPRSSVLTIAFKNPDPTIVQPVLEAVLESYMAKHRAVRLMPDDYLLKQRDELRTKLAQTEDELKRLKLNSRMPFPEEASRAAQRQIARIQDELMDAERELEERKAIMGEKTLGNVEGKGISVPAQDLSEYTFANTHLEELNRQKSELLLNLTEAHPVVLNIQDRITKLNRQKAELEARYPSLKSLLPGAGHLGTNAVPTDVLMARVRALNTVLSNAQAQASQVIDLEPKIADLQRLRVEEQRAYETVMHQIERQQRDEGRQINMSPVQNPAPPILDCKKMLKFVGVVLFGCIGMGIGLAFLIDLFLDRSIKRSSEIERLLRLPVLLSIPDTKWKGWFALPRWLTRCLPALPVGSGNGAQATSRTGTAVVPWDPSNQLKAYSDGLRERVMSYFEVQNLNGKKPKLVAVTGCTEGAGVSTLASGLAASLSNIGDGNVLLVDMNDKGGMAHSFYKGRPGCGITDVLEPEHRAGAQVQENLYLATINHGNGTDKLVQVLPSRFNHLMPKLKASDYDYIIFDMPPVTQTSATPRLASYMDLALLVIESEKTGQHSAARASALLREVKANVAAVLNKHRSHMPASLAQEA